MLTAHVEKLKDVAIVKCVGRLVRGEGVRVLKNVVVSGNDTRVIVLDLSDVESVDAAGLTALVSLHHWSRSRNIELKLINPSRFVLEMLDRTKLSSVLRVSSFHDALVAIVGSDCSELAAHGASHPCCEHQQFAAGD
ncbi:MAG TPA: STAS domain-containing protein [Terriglobales bacterium]|nr:STAS domain-containing protein [Terriglobales bacterium]